MIGRAFDQDPDMRRNSRSFNILHPVCASLGSLVMLISLTNSASAAEGSASSVATPKDVPGSINPERRGSPGATELGRCRQIATPTEVNFCENTPLDQRMCWYRTPLYNTPKWFCIAYDENWSNGKFRKQAKSLKKPLITIEKWRIDKKQRANVLSGNIPAKKLNICYEDAQRMDREGGKRDRRYVIFRTDYNSCGYKFEAKRSRDPKKDDWYYPNPTVPY